jgi:hypothetical protein
MASVINASVSSNGIVSTADASGILKVQSNGKTTNALAWVKWTGGSSPVISANYNVSSITRVSTGVYGVNFTTSTTDANYVPLLSATGIYNGTVFELSDNTGSDNTLTQTTSQFYFAVRYNGGSTPADPTALFVAVFGN